MCIDRETGKLISAKPFAVVNWAKKIDLKTGRPVENPDARYTDKMAVVMPRTIGAHNWQPMSFDPNTGLVYIPSSDGSAIFAPEGTRNSSIARAPGTRAMISRPSPRRFWPRSRAAIRRRRPWATSRPGIR